MADDVLHSVTPKGVVKRFHKPRWYKAFIASLRDSANVRLACDKAGITRTTAYTHRHNDNEFAVLWDEAMDDAADVLEQEARRRAHEGLKRYKFLRDGTPIMHPVTGEPYVEHEYSDRLLEFLLKGARPEKYRDAPKVSVDIDTGKAKDMSDDERAVEASRLLAKAAERKAMEVALPAENALEANVASDESGDEIE